MMGGHCGLSSGENSTDSQCAGNQGSAMTCMHNVCYRVNIFKVLQYTPDSESMTVFLEIGQ